MARSSVSQGGFTLIELLVALSVFVVMSFMAYQGLAALLKNRDIVEQRMTELAGLQQVFNILGADLEQAVGRPVMDAGGTEQAALLGGTDLTPWLELTSGGRSNFRRVPRSSLQRVAYVLEDREIRRVAWTTLDRGTEAVLPATPLLGGVLDLEISFIGGDGGRYPSWPQNNLAKSAPVLPRAVEITIEIDGWGSIRRLFELAGGR